MESAREVEKAGFAGVYCWDHHISRGRKTDPVLECWTTLTAAAAHTSRIKVGSFVTNVMNRQPAILARMLATLWDQSGGRVDLAIGVGGSSGETVAYGINFPEPAERLKILEEAVKVIRLMWTGGPLDFDGQYLHLKEAWSYPRPEPPPRIIIGGEKPAGAKLAARAGDGWTTNAVDYEELLPIHLAELSAHGRSRAQISHLLAVQLSREEPLDRQPLIADMAAFAAEWQEKGADELIVSWVRPAELPALLEAAARAGLPEAAAGR
jgi:alkanesulfonate monooxygenase SsuD/methylene tetrahydromethanopterin reductase-like flavin-dependent oxidoreductase (luciferase family)